ncbi:MAG: hypothetical protein JNL38_22855 [Myxococcales bacterium]|jgi:hypothetical protein|nr:hypothetical protein [Myxococcales bacterium]
MRLTLALGPVACVLLVACGGAASEGAHPVYSALPQTSSASQSIFSGSGSSASVSAPSAPHDPAPTPGARPSETLVNVVAKPDVLVLKVALRAANTDATRAVDDLKTLGAEIERAFQKSAGADSKLVMYGATVELDGPHKKSGDKEPQRLAVTAQGAIEIPLRKDAGYWDRARTFSAAMQVAEHENRALCEGPLRAHVSSAEARVKNAQGFRDELLERWAKNNRTFAKTAQLADKPLEATSCTPPSEVHQRMVSLEEVELTLPVSCQPLQIVR